MTASSPAGGPPYEAASAPETDDSERTLELREEQLVAHKELRELGEVEVRTEIEEVPGRLEVDAFREEVYVEHEPVGKAVSERTQPWEEDGALVVPIYEEQLVVSKRLVLRERLRIRRVRTTERQLFQDTLRQEHLVVEDPQGTGLVHEVH
ncbi:MAG: YsnF/AvaK domain-containing protein, partial [Chloroflexi bacterium]|nr:YsnF/AvaK domain-containing protein [Chloroflexota bacterium]